MRPPGVSALHQACVLGNVKILILLLDYGANINQKTFSELSPLQVATLFGHFEAAQCLILRGADSIDIRDGFKHDVRLMSTVLVK